MDEPDYFDKMDTLANDKQTCKEPKPALQHKLNSKILVFKKMMLLTLKATID